MNYKTFYLQEKRRLKAMSFFEERLKLSGFLQIAGVDEAGRGPLAGPVVSAAVILPDSYFLEFLNDSKKIEKEKRKELFSKLTSDPFVIYSIGIVNHEKIDEINILAASLLSMKLALQSLQVSPDYVLIDGNILPDIPHPAQAIVSGDEKSISIAAASIIAKCTRDKMMEGFHEKWPKYGFDRHKGYATQAHLKAIQQYGPCEIHRKSFNPVRSFLLKEKSIDVS